MQLPNRKQVERILQQFPHGSLVELLRMDDISAPPIGRLANMLLFLQLK